MQSKITLVLAIISTLLVISCSKQEKGTSANEVGKNSGSAATAVIEIASTDAFNEMVLKSDNTLIVIDLYADWCGPCKMLSPILNSVAIESSGKAAFYKINVDKFPDIAASFNVRSIPLVVLMKNQKSVVEILGLRAKEDYLKAVAENQF